MRELIHAGLRVTSRSPGRPREVAGPRVLPSGGTQDPGPEHLTPKLPLRLADRLPPRTREKSRPGPRACADPGGRRTQPGEASALVRIRAPRYAAVETDYSAVPYSASTGRPTEGRGATPPRFTRLGRLRPGPSRAAAEQQRRTVSSPGTVAGRGFGHVCGSDPTPRGRGRCRRATEVAGHTASGSMSEGWLKVWPVTRRESARTHVQAA
jgi:hypothetical protein